MMADIGRFRRLALLVSVTMVTIVARMMAMKAALQEPTFSTGNRTVAIGFGTGEAGERNRRRLLRADHG